MSDEDKIMYISYFDFQKEKLAKTDAEPKESNEGPPEEQKTDATAEASQPTSNADVTEEKKADEIIEEDPDLNWKDMIKSTDTLGPRYGDTTNTYASDIDKLKEAYTNNKLPQIESITIFTEGTYCYGCQIDYHGGV